MDFYLILITPPVHTTLQRPAVFVGLSTATPDFLQTEKRTRGLEISVVAVGRLWGWQVVKWLIGKDVGLNQNLNVSWSGNHRYGWPNREGINAHTRLTI